MLSAIDKLHRNRGRGGRQKSERKSREAARDAKLKLYPLTAAQNVTSFVVKRTKKPHYERHIESVSRKRVDSQNSIRGLVRNCEYTADCFSMPTELPANKMSPPTNRRNVRFFGTCHAVLRAAQIPHISFNKLNDNRSTYSDIRFLQRCLAPACNLFRIGLQLQPPF